MYYNAIFALLLHHFNSLLHCNNELIFTYYNSLLHIIAYYCILLRVSSCLDRAKGQSTRNNGNPARSQNLKPTTGRLGDDSASFKLMCTKAWGRSPQQSWNRWTWPRGAVLARLSVQITQTTAEIIETSVVIMISMPPAVPDRDQDPGIESGEYTGRTSARLTVYPGLSMRIICFKLQLSTIFQRLLSRCCG